MNTDSPAFENRSRSRSDHLRRVAYPVAYLRIVDGWHTSLLRGCPLHRAGPRGRRVEDGRTRNAARRKPAGHVGRPARLAGFPPRSRIIPDFQLREYHATESPETVPAARPRRFTTTSTVRSYPSRRRAIACTRWLHGLAGMRGCERGRLERTGAGTARCDSAWASVGACRRPGGHRRTVGRGCDDLEG